MIRELTSLRGIFILLMFFWHCMNIYPGGAMVASFFFVVSGFSLTLGYKDKLLQSGFSYKQYLMRRCIKFFPLHWMCLIAAVILQMSFSIKGIPIFLANAALIQSLIPDSSYYFSYNAVSWYLSDILFFAAVFPFLCKWLVKASSGLKLRIGLMFVLLYVTVAIFIPSEWHHSLLYISPLLRLTDFVLGIYLALFYLHLNSKDNKNISEWVVVVLILLLAIEPYFFEGDIRLIGPVYWPLIAVLLLTTSLLGANGGGKLLVSKPLQVIGNHSFSIFMIHQLVIRYLGVIFIHLHLDKSFLYIAITLFVTIIVSILVDNEILKPITNILYNRKRKTT